MALSDAAVVALARDGDSEAFRALVERHGRAVFRLAHRMTGSRTDAEDIVQETFIRAYRQLSRFESRASFGTWIHRIAMNCTIDLLRSRGSYHEAAYDDELLKEPSIQQTVPRAPSPERLILSREVKDAVQNAMGALSPLERSAFVLRHFEGRSHEEIGEALGLGTSATKHSIFRAVRKMRVVLAPFVES
ncbi:MAG: sigma-70 family RNA polymerase sigma factor [Luteitalea sp.]|nr:sigma-70 family RNA polymerase sigma factor [Luteitalea sp.]